MNTSRLVVLGLAAVAAGGAAFLARGLLGGGTSQVAAKPAPAPVTTAQVLVASSDLVPGTGVTADQVHWQEWPKKSVDPSFITGDNNPNIDQVVKGTVVRAPIVAGEPITDAKIVHADTASFMSASLTPGMRAVSIAVSVASLAGGFIQPNDRVDLVLTSQSTDNNKKFRATTILRDVRVLAIDQAFDDKNRKPVADVKTATLELTPQQAERVTRAQASGVLSLSLRSLVEHVAGNAGGQSRVAAARAKYNENTSNDGNSGEVSVIRYGVMHSDATTGGE
ncbi:MAG: Flp pilus assembly protein CpaB [Alphaproteobacteria bacterium]|nr:Flp pilus assembly protein CpaB [Alphaproteobacteria bacterium]